MYIVLFLRTSCITEMQPLKTRKNQDVLTEVDVMCGKKATRIIGVTRLEWLVAGREPRNYGYPYCLGNGEPRLQRVSKPQDSYGNVETIQMAVIFCSGLLDLLLHGAYLICQVLGASVGQQHQLALAGPMGGS